MKIVGVTACVTGVAHTYMAQAALEKSVKKEVTKLKLKLKGVSELKMNYRKKKWMKQM